MSYRMVLLAGVLAAAVPMMYGQTALDPATLFTGSGVTCTGGCNNNGGEPNLLGTTAIVDIYQNQGGSTTISSGNLFLILAVPNGQGAPSGTLTETDWETNSNGTITQTDGGNGQATLVSSSTIFDSSSTGDVYSALSLNGGDNSNLFTNLTCASGSNCAGNPAIPTADLNATSFTLFLYKMTGSTLVSNGYSQFEFGSDLPLGTYAIGYGCTSTFGTIVSKSGIGTSGCLDSKGTGFSNGDTYSTPFTRSGLVDGPPVTPTPEPADAVLLATMLLGCGVLARRRYRFAGRK